MEPLKENLKLQQDSQNKIIKNVRKKDSRKIGATLPPGNSRSKGRKHKVGLQQMNDNKLSKYQQLKRRRHDKYIQEETKKMQLSIYARTTRNITQLYDRKKILSQKAR